MIFINAHQYIPFIHMGNELHDICFSDVCTVTQILFVSYFWKPPIFVWSGRLLLQEMSIPIQ